MAVYIGKVRVQESTFKAFYGLLQELTVSQHRTLGLLARRFIPLPSGDDFSWLSQYDLLNDAGSDLSATTRALAFAYLNEDYSVRSVAVARRYCTSGQ